MMKLDKQMHPGGDHVSGHTAKRQVGGNKRARIVWASAQGRVPQQGGEGVGIGPGSGLAGHHFLLDVYLWRAVPHPRSIAIAVDWVFRAEPNLYSGAFRPHPWPLGDFDVV